MDHQSRSGGFFSLRSPDIPGRRATTPVTLRRERLCGLDGGRPRGRPRGRSTVQGRADRPGRCRPPLSAFRARLSALPSLLPEVETAPGGVAVRARRVCTGGTDRAGEDSWGEDRGDDTHGFGELARSGVAHAIDEVQAASPRPVTASRPPAAEWRAKFGPPAGSCPMVSAGVARCWVERTDPVMVMATVEPISRVVSFMAEATPWRSGPRESTITIGPYRRNRSGRCLGPRSRGRREGGVAAFGGQGRSGRSETVSQNRPAARNRRSAGSTALWPMRRVSRGRAGRVGCETGSTTVATGKKARAPW